MSAAVPAGGLRIGGRTVDASDGGSFAVADPASEETIAEVANGTVQDALAAADAAAAAAADWAGRAPRERSEILRAAFETMTARAGEIAELIVRENGKPRADAEGETAYAAEFFRWYAEEAVRNLGSFGTAPSGANRMLVVHQPVGVCLLITPWNFPAAMATRKIGPALAAGCTVVLKPASETPLTALLVADVLAEAGVPDGVVNVVPSRRSGDVAAALLGHDAVRKLSFTGSTEIGRLLLRAAADRVVNTSMELGGNAPFLVFADADLDAAVDGAMVAKMRNIGEACTAANRFYVEAPVAEEFAERLAARMGALDVGPGLDGAAVGPLVNAAAVESVGELVDDATGRGARVLCGGAALDRAGHFYAPTVLAGVPAGARLLGEEIFGPVAPVVAFDSEDEAIAAANDTEYGLVSYVYSRDLDRALRVGERLEAGMIAVNRGLVSDPAAPFGGVKQSGLGREGGHEGLLDYTESKYFAIP
ncbi:MAG: NAD-dependent succinate-semialdehyde dehydrogenase [Solirubrobacterales bacterium]|nr:NAD-dependent succinate-semialdehyde dehydrogenase [Solirubrobacterales bacterium]